MRPYQAFFKKRLQTQSFLDTQMCSTNMTDLTTKIISSLKFAHQEGSKKRQKVQMARSRVKTKQNEQAEDRDKLKQNIDSRMRISRTNLQKVTEERKKALSSRSQMQQTRRKKFRESQNIELQKSLMKVRQKQKETEKFFRDTQTKKQEQYKRLQQIGGLQKTRYQSYYTDKRYRDSLYETGEWLKQSRNNSSTQSIKPLKKVLRVAQSEIRHKQQKKKNQEIQKQCKYLSEYVSKMQNILNVRKKGNKQSKQPSATLPKVIKNERNVSPKRTHIVASFKDRNNQESPQKKVSFSQMYMQKLSEKKTRKQFYHSLILKEGDEIMLREQEKKKTLKQSKLIKQSLNEYKRWSNMISGQKQEIFGH